MRPFTLFSPPKTPFQILSDLHLNHASQYLTFHIPVSAPYLILAGNIGRLIDYDSYLSFLIRRCNLHEKVYLVPGALEFHGLSWMDGLQLAHRMEKEPQTRGRLEVLYETRADVPGTKVSLLGATLWSRIAEGDAAAVVKRGGEFDAATGMREWGVERHNSEHRRDLRWLLEEVRGLVGAGRRVVVVTAFAPDLQNCLEPWQVDAPWAAACGTDLLGGMGWKGVDVWVCGTTGRTCEVRVNGVRVVSNQRGREDESVTGMLRDGLSEKQKVGVFDVMRVVRV
ncbi:ser/Thr protein phosphatase superfamily [Dothidotthia symphoricarpi CBS 119687]|uniref:Ser/Thr protein phosphatase superfamily n=1 Tax=Dothidotthia symphoricarpi CBS 119687 TaxID=1392245 RepID=A0A6A6A1X8_9PLEO|nr:ser/Thr protein phosphatase superfamily [Dothidotthia symphoricarpi CBS 119687]KAF2125205.1 ser/Thr protein phosphatase superfamily [Dothidotthia symphoricarpi CBS 119687]